MTDDIETIPSMIPSQESLEVGEEYLLPTSFIRRAHGGNGERFEAVRIKIVEKHIDVDESSHKASEGY